MTYTDTTQAFVVYFNARKSMSYIWRISLTGRGSTSALPVFPPFDVYCDLANRICCQHSACGARVTRDATIGMRRLRCRRWDHSHDHAGDGSRDMTLSSRILSIVLGIWPDLGVLMIAAFLIPTTILFHPFWTFSDATQRRTQRGSFFRNISLLGATLALFAFLSVIGPGKFAITGSLFNLR